MNKLVVGKKRYKTILDSLTGTFLLLDDGPLIDLLLPHYRTEISESRLTHFRVDKHSFNPIQDITPRGAKEFAKIIYDAAPEASTTLTVRNGKRALRNLVLENDRIDQLTGDRKDPAIAEALATIDDLLVSDVVRDVFCNPSNFVFTEIILVRLDRSQIDDDDAFVIGNILIAEFQRRYKGHIAISDFGFYARPSHVSLIRQNRLIAGVNFLDEVTEKMRNSLLLIDDKIPKGCTNKDAETLAPYCGYGPTITGHSGFIQRSIE